MRMFLLALLTAGLGMAGSLNGPVPGFVLDARSGSIRSLLGIPGAMQLGPALNLPFQVTSADFSRLGSRAVAISNETPSHVYVIQNLSSPAVSDLGPVATGSTVLGLNSTGQVAVLSAPGQLQFVSGINGTPAVSAAISASALLGPVSAGIVDDAGQCALLATSANSLGALETLCADGTSQRILVQPGLQISALSLANQGQDVILADSAGQQVLLVAGYARSAAVSILATSRDGINNPVGVQVNGQQAIVADSAAASVFLIDLSGRNPVQAIAIMGTPGRLKLLADPTVALLTDPTALPFTVFDLQAMQSFFIPTH
jgi:hypothetical protein